jgi:hypothetical protein
MTATDELQSMLSTAGMARQTEKNHECPHVRIVDFRPRIESLDLSIKNGSANHATANIVSLD